MKKIKWPTHPAIIVSVVFCFNNEKKLLLIKQRDKDYWTPISGEVEKNEIPAQTAIREAKEELGLDIKVVRALTPTIRWQNEYKDAIVILFHFLCQIAKGKIKHMKTSEPGYDVMSHKWVGLGDIAKGKIRVALSRTR